MGVGCRDRLPGSRPKPSTQKPRSRRRSTTSSDARPAINPSAACGCHRAGSSNSDVSPQHAASNRASSRARCCWSNSTTPKPAKTHRPSTSGSTTYGRPPIDSGRSWIAARTRSRPPGVDEAVVAERGTPASSTDLHVRHTIEPERPVAGHAFAQRRGKHRNHDVVVVMDDRGLLAPCFAQDAAGALDEQSVIGDRRGEE